MLVIRRIVVAGLAILAILVVASRFVRGVQAAPLALVVAAQEMLVLVFAILAGVWFAWCVRRSTRRERILSFGSFVVLAAIVVAGCITASPVGSDAIPSARQGELRILSWNTNQDRVSAGAIGQLVRETDPDVIVLPEYFGEISNAVTYSLPERGYSRAHWAESAASTAWVRTGLGAYRVSTRGVPPWAGFALEPRDPRSGAPTFVVAHLEHAEATSSAVWTRHLDWVTQECAESNVIVVGDLNATTQNLPATGLGSCRDAADTLGAGGTGTWPTVLPAGLGAQIDRVLATRNWIPARFRVISSEDFAGSDHRPIVVDLAPR